MLKLSLGGKLAGIILATMLSSSLIYIAFINHDAVKHAQNDMKYHTSILAKVTALNLNNLNTKNNSGFYNSYFHEVGKIYESISSIEFLDVDNKLVAAFTSEEINEGIGYSHKEPVLSVGGDLIGHLVVSIKGIKSNHWLHSHIPEMIGSSLIQSFSVAIILLISIRLLVVRPIQTLIWQARRIGDGKLCEAIYYPRNDEIGILAGVMEKMRVNLNDLYNEILQQYAELDQRVEERTKELKEKNRQLEDAQNQLVQSEKIATVGMLAAGIAHEINNPVGYIGSNLQSMEQYVDAMDDIIRAYEENDSLLEKSGCYKPILSLKKQYDLDYIREDLPDLIESCKDGIFHIGDTVKELLTFSHQHSQEWQPVDLCDCIASTLRLVQPEIKNLEADLQPVPTVWGIASQLNQVFLNLLINAAHATDHSGAIRMSIGHVDDVVEIKVMDNGNGVPDNIKDKVFDPFFTTKKAGKGSGLGLSVSYSIIEKHGGELYLDPDYKEGCCFVIRLPLMGQ